MRDDYDDDQFEDIADFNDFPKKKKTKINTNDVVKEAVVK